MAVFQAQWSQDMMAGVAGVRKGYGNFLYWTHSHVLFTHFLSSRRVLGNCLKGK